MGRYKKPNKINIISSIVFLALAALVYVTVQFGPVYYRKWQAKAVIGKLANKIYSKRRVVGEEEEEIIEQAQARALKRLRRIGIKDTNIELEIEKNNDWVMVKAAYREVIHHPLIDKTTKLQFYPWVKVQLDQSLNDLVDESEI